MNLIGALKSSAMSIGAAVLGHPMPEKSESYELRVEFPYSTLPLQLRGVFLVSMQHRILNKLGETAPFKTRLLLCTHSGLKDIDTNPHAWGENAATLYLRTAGPHAREVSLMLETLVDEVLSTTVFDKDGYVVTGHEDPAQEK